MAVQAVERGFRVEKVAEIFGVHKNTIMRWVAEGNFPAPGRNGRTNVWFESQLLKKQKEMLRS